MISKTIENLVKVFVAASILFSCGGGSNNDQGIGVTLIGLNTIDEKGACQEDTFTDAITVPINLSNGTDGQFTGVVRCLQVQNNLSTVGINLDRVLLNFFIPGASEQPEGASLPVGRALGPGTKSIDGPNSSLPPSFRNISNVGSVIVDIVPTAIREFLNFNRNSLPELPYSMQVQASVSGITTAGDRIQTNITSFQVFFTPADTVIPPTGEGSGAEGLTEEEGLEEGGA